MAESVLPIGIPCVAGHNGFGSTRPPHVHCGKLLIFNEGDAFWNKSNFDLDPYVHNYSILIIAQYG